jgi:hypothetical protein
MFELFTHVRPEPDMRFPVRWLALAFTLTPAEHIGREQETHLLSFLSAVAERYGRRLTAG